MQIDDKQTYLFSNWEIYSVGVCHIWNLYDCTLFNIPWSEHYSCAILESRPTGYYLFSIYLFLNTYLISRQEEGIVYWVFKMWKYFCPC